jgi:DNA-binding NarL/FixJ family response regulator
VSILLLCDDLLFGSKVTATARAHGIPVVVKRDPTHAMMYAFGHKPACVIVDLHLPFFDIGLFLKHLRAGTDQMPKVIGFGSHVDAELLKAARRAGCDVVMPRSQFSDQVEEKLKEWATA